MRQLFVRIYVALGLVLAFGVALAVEMQRPHRVLWEKELEVMSAFPEELAAAVGGAADPEAEAEAIEELARRYRYPVRLVPRAAAEAGLQDMARQRLSRGQPVVSVGEAGARVLVPVPAEPFVAVLGPVPTPHDPPPSPLAVALLVGLLLTAGAVPWLLRPLDRQLGLLTLAAHRLGRGEMNARAGLESGAALGPLASSFDEMASRVQRLLQSRQDLLHAVSHELRTPLQRMRFGLVLLEDARDEAGRSSRAAEIEADLTELDAMVEELLAWSRHDADAAAARPVTVDPTSLLESLVDDARRLREGVTVELRIPKPLLQVRLDPAGVRRALGNLLANAVRYGSGRVRLTALTLTEGFQVDVEDDGPGVPAADRERIFEPFVRLDAARSRDTGGTGLGLAIAASIARAHGGTLTVADGDLGGARFRWWSPRP